MLGSKANLNKLIKAEILVGIFCEAGNEAGNQQLKDLCKIMQTCGHQATCY